MARRFVVEMPVNYYQIYLEGARADVYLRLSRLGDRITFERVRRARTWRQLHELVDRYMQRGNPMDRANYRAIHAMIDQHYDRFMTNQTYIRVRANPRGWY